MVSFQCDGCADTVKKPKLDQHRQRCWASFTCLDCSKTFQNQEYKAHTSCISEAEKYQGALYRGPKKNGQPQPTAPTPAIAPSTALSTPLDSAASSPAPPAIHPSRLGLVDTPDSAAQGYGRGGPSGRGGAYGRGGRGGRGGMAVQSAPPRGRGKLVSGENTRAPETGMRSWGSPAVVDDVTESFSATPMAAPIATTHGTNGASGEAEKKKKKKKGDKGGTGSKANSKRPKGDESANGDESEAPAAKKRKRSASPERSAPAPAPAPATTATTTGTTIVSSSEIPDKTLKRLRKNASKVGEKAKELSLAEWMKLVGEGKKEQVDVGDVNRAAKVKLEDGKWVLSF